MVEKNKPEPSGPQAWPRSVGRDTEPTTLKQFLYSIPIINWLLFFITCFTTLTAGANLQGINLWETPWQLYKGLPFSLSLLLILLCHEMGHYFTARYHNIDVSFPYFLPAPPILFLIGTFGAFIRIRSPISNKPALLDVGVAGPLTGILITLPLLVLGLQLSDVQVMPRADEMPGVFLGESIIFKIISWLIFGTLPEDHIINRHPIALAAWFGLLVTNINLIPIGQLDGGHVCYALFGEKSKRIGEIFFLLIIILGIVFWPGWLVWAVLLYFLVFRNPHPQPLQSWVPLDPKRRLIGYLTIAVFILTFMPAPFIIQ